MADYTIPDTVEKRLRYFDGQFLRDQDFIDEQNYHLDRQQRHNRLLHSPGIVSGLEVTVKAETGEVTIAPGTAMDSAGRQIVLSKEVKQNLESTMAGQALLVYVAFAQETADLAQVGSAEFTRWLEQPVIEIVREDTPPQGRDPVVLARLPIGQDGKVTQVDNAARGYAGVRLPGGPTLAANSTGQAQFTGALRVSGSPQEAGGNTLILGSVESSNLRLGYHPNYSWIQSHGSKPLAINPLGNNVGIGTDNPQGALHIAALGEALLIKPKAMTGNDVAKIVFADPDNGTGPMSIEYKDSGSPALAMMGGNLGVGTRDPAMRLSVSASGNHTQLRREKTETTGGKQLFLELYQDDPSNAIPEVNPSIRFHHNNKYFHRIEGRSDGIHFREGNLAGDGYIRIFSGGLTVNGSSALNGNLAVSASNNQAQLRREKTETVGGKQLFLELYQDDPNNKVPEVNPSIRFHHNNKYWHRIEARSNGLHFKEGNIDGDGYSGVFTGNLTTDRVYLGKKWSLSGVGDGHGNDDWLRLFNTAGNDYYGGIAMGKLWVGKDGEIGGNLSVSGKVIFSSSGRVGIGTTTPRVPLEVYGGGVAQYADYYHYLARSGVGDSSNQNGSYSIRVSDRIWAAEFNATSDARIKNIQGRSDSVTDLGTLLGLEITDFHYKDVIGKGSAPHKRLIGQQVEKVFPQAVSLHTDVVPDIYQLAPLRQGWVALATELEKGERVKLITEKGAEGVYEVLEVTPDKFRTDFQPEGDEGDKVFVFGREVNDFRVLDYDAIAMLNVSATQQIKKELEAEVKARQAESAELKARLEALEQEVLARV